MVREFGYAAAARYLDDTEQQVRQGYQYFEAAERTNMATEALSQTNQRARSESPASEDDLRVSQSAFSDIPLGTVRE